MALMDAETIFGVFMMLLSRICEFEFSADTDGCLENGRDNYSVRFGWGGQAISQRALALF